jgi:nucleotidyltransferase substrate binding protein (TIGR01987 family)
MNEYELAGFVKAFETTYELAWNVMKDYLTYQGITGITGSRDAIRYAFRYDLIGQGETWMKMSDDRNRTTYTYDRKIADEINDDVLYSYLPLFDSLENKLLTLL